MKVMIYSKAHKEIIFYHKRVVNFITINFLFFQATCAEPDIPSNGNLHSTSQHKNSYGEYPHGTEAIFRGCTGN